MIFINEWLPNPTESDSQNEWVELWNDGPKLVSLAGWSLVTKSGAKEKLSLKISAGKYLLLPRSQTKLVLKNADENKE